MLVFLATPYSQLCDEKYRVKQEYVKFFKKLTSKIKELGVDYFLAIERENYGKEYSSDKESTLIDYNTIQKCDLLCVLPGIPNSGGVHVEIGWASANKKKINMFLNKNAHYTPMVTGLEVITDVKNYYYEKEYSDELIDLICESIKIEIGEEIDDIK